MMFAPRNISTWSILSKSKIQIKASQMPQNHNDKRSDSPQAKNGGKQKNNIRTLGYYCGRQATADLLLN
jgi:hypothetical protein